MAVSLYFILYTHDCFSEMVTSCSGHGLSCPCTSLLFLSGVPSKAVIIRTVEAQVRAYSYVFTSISVFVLRFLLMMDVSQPTSTRDGVLIGFICIITRFL